MDFMIRNITDSLNEKDLQDISIFNVKNIFGSLNNDIKMLMIKKGEEWLIKPFPQLPMSLYLEFERNGNRSQYEEKYFSRRIALRSVIFAELVENKGRFIDKITDFLYEISNETVWWVPAHNRYENGDTLLFPDATRPVLALFSAETGAILTVASYLLQDYLSEELQDYIYMKVQQRIYNPYENDYCFWKGVVGRNLNNWGPWCTQNCLISYFFQEKNHENRNDKTRLLIAMRQASWTLDYFISGYGTDGGCDEGPGYFHHSGLTFYISILLLNAVTNGAYKSIFKIPKVQNIIGYIWDLNIEEDNFANFGDSSSIIIYNDLIKYSFAKSVDNENLMLSFVKKWRTRTLEAKYLLQDKDSRNLFEHVLNLKLSEEVKDIKLNSFKLTHRNHAFYPSIGRYVFRNNNNVVAVAAGTNNESHNHNDCGSFIYTTGNHQVCIDIGTGAYTKKTFSKDRYSIWTMQSSYHNLTNFGDNQQKAGERYHAEVINLTNNSIEMELSTAYEIPELKSYRRKISLNDKGLNLQETIDYSGTATLSLILYDKPNITEGKIILFNGENIIYCNAIVVCEEIRIEDNKLRRYLPAIIYRILISYKDYLSLLFE